MRLLIILAAVLLATSTVSAQSAVPTWSLQPELRIGSADDGPYAFNEIGHIVVSPTTGAIVIAHYGEIRVFSADGRYLHSIGRRGGGPGEFTRLTGLGWSGDLLTAFARQNAMHFTEQGTLVQDRRLDVRAEGTTIGTGSPTASLAGGFYLWRHYISPVLAAPGERTLAPLIRTNGEGDDQILDQLVQELTWRRGPLVGPHPLSGPSHFAADRSGTAVVIVHQHPPNGNEDAWFRVRKLNGAGGVLFARNYAFEPRAVPPAFEDSLIRNRAELIRSVPSLTPIPRLEATLRDVLRTPRFQPPVTGVLLAEDGSIWLRREDLDMALVTWWILDSRGDLVGQLRLPPRQRIMYVDGDTVWGVERDSLDVPYAVRYQIRR